MCQILGYDDALLHPTLMENHSPLAPRPRDVSLNVDKALAILKTRILSTEEGLLSMRG
jgi:hypothetical protein